MKFQTNEILNSGKYTTRNTYHSAFLIPFTLLLIILPLSFMRTSNGSSSVISAIISNSLSNNRKSETKGCDIFSGEWIPYPEGPYYSNETCPLIIDQQNCMKFGRPDREYLHWRWKPNECDLQLFNATQFLELVRGKKMVFVGDSVGRNQMQSLLCLLNPVSQPEDISLRYSSNPIYFRTYYYADHNFTLANLWSPFLVRGKDDDPDGHSYNSIMRLYLDEPDEAWASKVEDFDILMISAGHWFFRPLLFYEKGKLVGCYRCMKENVTDFSHYYGYKKAFKTVFRTITNLENFKGLTFLRTFSPSHFENGDWNKGGNCARTKPFTKEDLKLNENDFVLQMYLSQVEEFKEAQKEAIKKGLQFFMIDTTEIMLLRPDGHPNSYGHSKNRNMTINDCVHWCLPGPVDTWNEFLLYILKMENQKSTASKIEYFKASGLPS